MTIRDEATGQGVIDMENLIREYKREEVPRPWEAMRCIPKIERLETLLGNDYSEALRGAFPDINCPMYPTGINILVQLYIPSKTKTFKNGKTFWLADETVTANQARVQTALVRALGPAAYRHRQTLALWPEGYWCVPGMFIRVPMYGGDRLEVPFDRPDGSGDSALFVTFKDQDCLSVITGDPTLFKTG